MVCRIYDKTRESHRRSRLGYWHQVWREKPKTVYRVEYQLRHKALKRSGPTDIDSVIARLGNLADYLLTWLYFAEPQRRKDRSHTKTSWWREFDELVRTIDWPTVTTRNSTAAHVRDIDHLEGMLIGVLATILAEQTNSGRVNLHDSDFDQQLFHALRDIVERHRAKLRTSLFKKLSTQRDSSGD